VTLAKEHSARRVDARGGGFVVRTVREASRALPMRACAFPCRGNPADCDTMEGVLVVALWVRKGPWSGSLGPRRYMRRRSSQDRLPR